MNGGIVKEKLVRYAGKYQAIQKASQPGERMVSPNACKQPSLKVKLEP